MRFVTKRLLTVAALAALAPAALGFSLMGPYAAWQVTALGYQKTGDIGGPMFLYSFYRWNVTNVTYAFDQSFINYFGTEGMKAVDEAFAMVNRMPPATELNINQYPKDSRLWNPVADQAGLLDLRSHTVPMVLQYLGLADPERFAWNVYYRFGGASMTNYYVIGLNYDPDTMRPTGMVNGIYYTYRITETNGVAEASERPVTSTDTVPYNSVAGGHLGTGQLYTSLTRDDVAGLKYLYHPNTLAIETLLPTVFPKGPVTMTNYGWIPWFGTTNVVTNNYFYSTNYLSTLTNLYGATNSTNFIDVAIRGGANKVRFTRVAFDSLIGNTFTPITNYYTDTLIATNKMISQQVYRSIDAPDIVFIADHLGFVDTVQPNGTVLTRPILTAVTDSTAWINNDALNGLTVEGGPGVITGPITISFTSDLGGLLNSNPYFLDETWAFRGQRWASFDNTTKTPVIYPTYEQITVDQLLRLIEQATNSTILNP